MTNDHRVGVRDFFFDIELDSAAAHMSRAGNVSLVPFVLLPHIDDQRLAAFRFRGRVSWRDLGDALLCARDQFLETSVLCHIQI